MNTEHEANEALSVHWAKNNAEARVVAAEHARQQLHADWLEYEQDDAQQARSKRRALGVAGFVVSCLLGIGLALFLLTFGAK